LHLGQNLPDAAYHPVDLNSSGPSALAIKLVIIRIAANVIVTSNPLADIGSICPTYFGKPYKRISISFGRCRKRC